MVQCSENLIGILHKPVRSLCGRAYVSFMPAGIFNCLSFAEYLKIVENLTWHVHNDSGSFPEN